jgi:DNA-binding NarL/FixJ family response regulator
MMNDLAQPAQTAIRILIADDHPVVRDGLVAMLETQPDFKIVAATGNGQEAVARALEARPDILLLDLEMPGMDGVEVLEQVSSRLPEARTIIFTAFDTDERILKALKMGAQGYLLKGSPRQELFSAIRTVYQGGSLLQPLVASKVLAYIRSSQAESGVKNEELTGREKEVMKLVALGMPNKEIARTLGITERTVKFHVSVILRKLNATNRTEAVKKAADLGINI